jgi:hypothetical protein
MLSEYARGKILDHVFKITPFTVPTNLYVGLSLTDPAPDGSGVTEPSGGSYARVLANDWDRSGDVVSNDAVLQFPAATGDWGRPLYSFISDASTAGNMICIAPMWENVSVFVGEADSDVITCPGHGFSDTDVVLVFGEDIPGNLSSDVRYFVRDANSDSFKLALTSGGVAINLSSVGWGRVGKDRSREIQNSDTALYAEGTLLYEMN